MAYTDYIANETVLIAIGLIFSYLVLYKKDKLIGNIAFLILGIATLALSTSATEGTVGIIILLGSIANTIYDFLNTKGKKLKNKH